MFPFFRPTEYIAIFFIVRIARFVGFPGNLTHVFLLIYRLSNNLISNVGLIPTLRVLLKLRALINYGMPLARLPISTFLPLNDYAVEQLSNNYWANILSNGRAFLRVYNFVLLPFVTLSSVAPILRLIFKASFSTFMTSIGIIWTVSDTTYSSIRYIAEQIVEFVENHTNLDIPRPNPDHTTPDLLNHNHQHQHINPVDNTPLPDNHTSYWLTGLSIALAGIAISLTALLLTEYVYPETVHSIPVLNTLCDCIHVA